MIGGILTYSDLGHNRPCGQAVGANGAGDKAFVIDGSPDDADEWAHKHLLEKERAGHRLKNVVFVRSDEQLWSGAALQKISPNSPYGER